MKRGQVSSALLHVAAYLLHIAVWASLLYWGITTAPTLQ